jgi:predicted DNA-binding transcriptional regulator AlpA
VITEAVPSSTKRYVRWPGVKSVLGFCWSRQWVIELTKRGEFPAPYRLSRGSVAWDVDELLAWRASRERAIPGRNSSHDSISPPKPKPKPKERVAIEDDDEPDTLAAAE